MTAGQTWRIKLFTAPFCFDFASGGAWVSEDAAP